MSLWVRGRNAGVQVSESLTKETRFGELPSEIRDKINKKVQEFEVVNGRQIPLVPKEGYWCSHKVTQEGDLLILMEDQSHASDDFWQELSPYGCTFKCAIDLMPLETRKFTWQYLKSEINICSFAGARYVDEQMKHWYGEQNLDNAFEALRMYLHSISGEEILVPRYMYWSSSSNPQYKYTLNTDDEGMTLSLAVD